MNLKVTPEDPRQLVLRSRASGAQEALKAASAIWEDPPDGYKVTDVRVSGRTGSGQRCNLSIWFRKMRDDAPLFYHNGPAWKELEVRLELLGVRT